MAGSALKLQVTCMHVTVLQNLDEIVPREYDFIYLRFDFNSGSNCGFGFLNFTSSEALLRFWKARLGSFWDEKNSRKLCMGGMAQLQVRGYHARKFGPGIYRPKTPNL